MTQKKISELTPLLNDDLLVSDNLLITRDGVTSRKMTILETDKRYAGKTSFDDHVNDETAHEKRDTKSNLDAWAIGKTNGSDAYATDEDKKYFVVDDVLVEVGSGGGGGGAVDSVNGQTGVVVLTTANISEATDKKYVTDLEKTEISNISSKLDSVVAGTNVTIDNTDPNNPIISATGGVPPVTSVNGQTGDVVLDTGDIAEVTDKNYVTDSELAEIATISSKVESVTSGEDTSVDNSDPINPIVNAKAKYFLNSAGVFSGGILSAVSGETVFDISAGVGYIQETLVSFGGADIAVPAIGASKSTHILIDASGSVVQQSTAPTQAQRRSYIYLGKIIHANLTTISAVNNQQETLAHVSNRFSDLLRAFKIINFQGNAIRAGVSPMKIQKLAGKIISAGVGYSIDGNDNPDIVTLGAINPVTFRYRTQSAEATGDIDAIDPLSYDLAGTVTAIAGGDNQATIQRVFLFPGGAIRIQYGQNIYANIATAIQNIGTANFVTESEISENGILIGLIIVRKGATNLSVSTDALFKDPSIFGEANVAASGSPVSSLQDALNNSIIPQMVLNADTLQLRNNAGNSLTEVFNVLDNAGSVKHLSVKKTEVAVNKLAFTNNATAKVEATTTKGNLKATDSVSSRILKSENYELYYQDFKEDLPSTIFSSTSASLTVNDVAGTKINTSNTMASITQSGASPADSTEIVLPLPTKKADWYLTPIKILEMLEVTGGSGTFGVTLQQSSDGVTFTALGSIPQLGASVSLNKSVVTVNDNSTHIKIKFSVIVADNATTLNVHRILISTDALPVGQTTIMGSGNFGYASTVGSNILNFNTEIDSDNLSKFLSYNATTGEWTAIKKHKLIVETQVSASGNGLHYYYLNGTIKYQSQQGALVASNYRGKGYYVFDLASSDVIKFGGVAIGTVSTTNFDTKISFCATAYADNVIVDVATTGLNTQSYIPLYQGLGTTPVTKIALFAQQGNRIKGLVRATAQTVTATEARIYLPTGYTVDDEITENLVVGEFGSARNDASVYTVLANGGNNYLTVGYRSSGASTVFSNQNGNVIANSSVDFWFEFDVPVNELDMSSQLISLNVSSERQSTFSLSGNDSRSVTANTESIPFGTATTNTGAWVYGADGSTPTNGNYISVQRSNSISMIIGAIDISTTETDIFLYKNGTLYKILHDGRSTYLTATKTFTYISKQGEFQAGDKLAFVMNTTATIGNNVTAHYLNYVELYEPQAYIAGQVALTEARTDGVEYRTNGKMNGEWLHARSWRVASDVTSSNASYVTGLPTTLTPVNHINHFDQRWVLLNMTAGGTSANEANVYYDKTAGNIGIVIGGTYKIGAGTILTMTYLK